MAASSGEDAVMDVDPPQLPLGESSHATLPGLAAAENPVQLLLQPDIGPSLDRVPDDVLLQASSATASAASLQHESDCSHTSFPDLDSTR